MNTPEKEILLIPKLDLSFNNIETQNKKESVAINYFNKNLKATKINQKEENKKLKNSFDPYLHRSKIIKNIKTKISVTNNINQKINTNLVQFFKKQKFTNASNPKEIKQNIN